jgi:hypothetical protein
VREIPDFSDQAVAAEDPVTPEHFNNVAGASRAMVENFGAQHRLTDDEHKAYLVSQAAAIVDQAAAVYNIRKAENFTTGTTKVARLAQGDVTVESDIEMRDADNWFPDVVPGPVSEPIYAFEIDSGTKSQKKCRLMLMDHNGALQDQNFGVRYFGQRNPLAAGLGASVPSAVDDLRRRISVDGVESAEHRMAMYDYLEAWRTRFAAKHHIRGQHIAQHNDHEVPIAVAFLKPGANLQSQGRVVWSQGPCAFLYKSRQSGNAAPFDIYHQVEFEMQRGTVWTGVRAIVRTTDTTPGVGLIPNPQRPYGGADRAGLISLGINTVLSSIAAVGVVVMGRYV